MLKIIKHTASCHKQASNRQNFNNGIMIFSSTSNNYMQLFTSYVNPTIITNDDNYNY